MTKTVQHPRRSQADRSAAARAALVAAATTVLSEQGYARATSVAIAEQADLSTGALHHHFATKEDLFMSVLDDVTTHVIALFSDLREEQFADAGLAAATVESLWAFYGAGAYRAVWEINIGWRSDKSLCNRFADHRWRSRDRMNAVICSNSFLSDRTKSTLLALLPFILSAMRGMFLETVASREDLFQSQLDILAGLLMDRLDEASAARRQRGARASKVR
ncbi:helix-turn-helix transcriptional regulator [Bradyrhizobium sp. 24]|uniref:TetR/AcrR family transcriptional regulator n=1 Tax=unclassified Bradyrhizobium TaxID=2631580 RepID=UPI001FF85D6F|nr:MULTISPECIES: TetR/AcrR family transcriptional regulator [unclassified Bradyrhizobium]MCK1299245.1 helix-turn-helix transcriptional regulator [Bradyrhizobium sp. 37]MCK1377302.1 helix-turn-helix transcriptional regulator [Bradyrhizobium sp. 24]MCK1769421.1 helix-turn-helix transcriptional regulator [Bradyrhizobium sp. 134]